MTQDRSRPSRRRYRKFVEDYKAKRLDALLDQELKPKTDRQAVDGRAPGTAPGDVQDSAAERAERKARRRRYLREYFSWLSPQRVAVSAFILLALTRAGLEMIEPLFMRYMVDKVLLNQALDQAARFARLNLTGTLFLTL